jgi:hypothetical protein
MESGSRKSNVLNVYDEFAYCVPGDDGRPWRRNEMEIISRNTEVSDEHSSLFAHIGHGFSVFNLGKTKVPYDSEGEKARLMADALPEGCALSTSACLVQVSRPRVSIKEQRNTTSTLLLVVWGRSPDDPTSGDTPTSLVKKHTRQTLVNKTQTTLGEGEINGTECETESFTYEQFALHPSVKQKLQSSSTYRAQIAAALLKASGIEPTTEVYSSDRSQLYSWMDTATCRVDVHEHCVALINDYNTIGQKSACIMHGPTRGLTLYTQRAPTAPTAGSSGSAPNQNHVLLECGAPTSDMLCLLSDATNSKSLTFSDEEMMEAIDSHMNVHKTPPCVHDHVQIGGHVKGSTKFSNFAIYDENYVQINALSYSSAFRDCASICCSTVATVLPSPVQACGGKIYGCIEHTLSAVQRHAQSTETHITVPNNREWREALIEISPGKAAFVFMNEQTADIDESTGEIKTYRISLKEIEQKSTVQRDK